METATRTSPVGYERDGAVAIVTIDNAPVNALSRAVREGLLHALNEALADPEVKAILLYGAGRGFSAGADIREFAGAPEKPGLGEVINAFEASPKPVVASVHGVALGGGLELALGCHYRVGLADARLGLPEVKLGLIPGAGGTQRLPRLIGIEPALEVMTKGEPVPAAQALHLGILDDVSEDDDPRLAGLIYAGHVVKEHRMPRRIRDMHDARLEVGSDFYAAFREQVRAKARGRTAPIAVIQAVEEGLALPFDTGLANERRLFADCLASSQHKALAHAFFGERAVSAVPGLAAKPRAIEKVGIVGAGTMGGGIAMAFANAGLPVTIVERDAETLRKGIDRVLLNYDRSVARGSLKAEEVGRRMDLISPVTDLDALGDVDLVVEAVFEDMEVKRDIFRRLDAVAKPGAVIATNTSYLDVGLLANETKRPKDVIGLHFFSPANVMRLLEIVRPETTSDETLATALGVAKRIGKIAVVAGVCEGFIGNRMFGAYLNEANRLLEEGALPHEVDAAIAGHGFAMGPFAVQDLAGLDIGYRNRRRKALLHPDHPPPSVIADTLHDLGRLGQKSGKGWYLYDGDGRTPTPDPEVEALIVAASKKARVKRRQIGADEIVARVDAALADEGARLLEEGIAAGPLDIDMVWLHGYGYPAHEGGPMFSADRRGLAAVRDDVKRLGRDPAPLLERLAGEGRGFYDWAAERGEKVQRPRAKRGHP